MVSPSVHGTIDNCDAAGADVYSTQNEPLDRGDKEKYQEARGEVFTRGWSSRLSCQLEGVHHPWPLITLAFAEVGFGLSVSRVAKLGGKQILKMGTEKSS